MTSLRAVMDRFQDSRFANDDGCPFPCQVTVKDSRVAVLTGDNATGKSLAFRHLAHFAQAEKVAVITLSIRERTGSGLSDMAGLRRSMIYGDESEQSTGATSVSVAERGFKNVVCRLEENPPVPTLLMFDEPEMGLSEGYAGALGQYLAEQVLSLPQAAPGLVVVSHSRGLVGRLADRLGQAPSFIYMGKEPKTLDEWLAHPEARTVEDLIALQALGVQGRRAWPAWLDRVKAEKTS